MGQVKSKERDGVTFKGAGKEPRKKDTRKGTERTTEKQPPPFSALLSCLVCCAVFVLRNFLIAKLFFFVKFL